MSSEVKSIIFFPFITKIREKLGEKSLLCRQILRRKKLPGAET